MQSYQSYHSYQLPKELNIFVYFQNCIPPKILQFFLTCKRIYANNITYFFTFTHTPEDETRSLKQVFAHHS